MGVRWITTSLIAAPLPLASIPRRRIILDILEHGLHGLYPRSAGADASDGTRVRASKEPEPVLSGARGFQPGVDLVHSVLAHVGDMSKLAY